MYKLTILFFILTAFNSQSLTDDYKITFENEYASYILKINNGDIVFENNQPYVTVTQIGDNVANTDKAPTNPGKIYKITKGSSFEAGLKIGGMDDIEIEKIGGTDDIEIEKIGETDEIEIEKIGGTDDIEIEKIGETDDIEIEKIEGDDKIDFDGKINLLLSGEKEHQAYYIILSYAVVTIVEKSSNAKQQFVIDDAGLFVYINGDKFNLFRI